MWVKGGDVLERMARVDTLVIDKTGTLTQGKPELTDVQGGDEVLGLAAAVEAGSAHPLADHPGRSAGARGGGGALRGFCLGDRQGGAGCASGRRVALGNAAMMADLGLAEPEAAALRAEGKTVMFVAVDGVYAGLVAVADAIKPGAAEAIRALKAEELRIIMATGEPRKRHGLSWRRIWASTKFRRDAAEEEALKFDRPARRGPQGRHGRRRRRRGRARLAAAEVGIAMGPGADVAVESAGMTLLSGDLTGILRERGWPGRRDQHQAEPGSLPLPTTPSASRLLRGC